MIFGGYKSTYLNSKVCEHASCTGCGERGKIENGIYAKYMHILWIPFISLGKGNITQCLNCGKRFGVFNTPEQVKQELQQLKSKCTIPKKHFFGSVAIILGIVITIISGIVDNRNMAKYIQSPAAKDVYEYTEFSQYSTMKVAYVTQDSIYFYYNKYAYNEKDNLYKIKADTCYKSMIDMMSKMDLKKMYDTDLIFNIIRD